MRYSNFDYIKYDAASKIKVSNRAKHINELISKIQMDLAQAGRIRRFRQSKGQQMG